jgi:hypothetical protein
MTRVRNEQEYLSWKKGKDNFVNLMTHFPNKIESEHISYGETSNTQNDYYCLRLKTYDLSEETLDTLQEFCQKNSELSYGVNDSAFVACDFYPDGFWNNSNIRPNRILKREFIVNYNSTNLLPMPRFDSFFKKKQATRTKYPNGYRIFILEASTKQILPDSLLPQKGIMPSNWLRGYSRGIVLSKENHSAFYWLIYW